MMEAPRDEAEDASSAGDEDVGDELELLVNEPLKAGGEAAAPAPALLTSPFSPPMRRRDSLMEKLHVREIHDLVLSSARRRASLCATLFALVLLCAMWREVSDAVFLVLNRLWIEPLAQADEANHALPSLNLFEYQPKVSFPVFRAEWPLGVRRQFMPQLPDRFSGANNSNVGRVWDSLRRLVEHNGGSLSEEEVDLRFTRPLQCELSGLIVYNHLLDKMAALLGGNPRLFREHIVLIEAPEDLVGRLGERIAAGSLLNLDGHHTNEALKICAAIQHPNLRRGNLHGDHICGKGFQTRQDVVVIRGLHPLRVIKVALEAGAESGFGLMHGHR
jgi:hypothetical protein